MRQTIADIARAAGVSTATVDRVLTSGWRARAAPASGCWLRRAASAICPARPAPPPQPGFPLDFVLPGRPQHLHGPAGRPSRSCRRRAGRRGRVRVHRVDGFSPEALAAACASCRPSGGVGLIALDHPVVREAIRDLGRRDVPVLTLVSDIANVPRVGYVGIDNRAAGRLAGHLLGRFVARARRARWRCSRARSAIAATRSARWASATCWRRSSRA